MPWVELITPPILDLARGLSIANALPGITIGGSSTDRPVPLAGRLAQVAAAPARGTRPDSQPRWLWSWTVPGKSRRQGSQAYRRRCWSRPESRSLLGRFPRGMGGGVNHSVGGANPSAIGLPDLARFRFGLRALDPIRLTEYPGSAWRGLLGHGLRRTVCVTRQPTARAACFIHGLTTGARRGLGRDHDQSAVEYVELETVPGEDQRDRVYDA